MSIEKKYVVGIDEVGRGPLAGPVTVCAFAIPKDLKVFLEGIPLRDSKKLSQAQREAWYRYITKHRKIHFAVSHIQPAVIDRINIREAANLGATRSYQKLLRRIWSSTIKNIFLDGGLYLNVNEKHVRTVIRGDEKYIAVRCASIIAKVTRDRLMCRLHKQYPQYGFHIHKGYGTKAHYRVIKKNGISKVHRRSFLKNIFVRV